MASSTKFRVGPPDDQPCWSCGSQPTVAIGNGGQMVYMRVCEECLLDLGGLEWPEAPNWIKPKSKTKSQMNGEVVSEWNRLTQTRNPVNWQKLAILLNGAREHFSHKEIMSMLPIAAENAWVKEQNAGLSAVLSADMLSRWARQVVAQEKTEAKVDKDKLAAEKLRMVEELFGADALTSNLEEQISMAETFEELEAIRDDDNRE